VILLRASVIDFLTLGDGRESFFVILPDLIGLER
jgi:hypothetical protein